jgi:hypothetical protein
MDGESNQTKIEAESGADTEVKRRGQAEAAEEKARWQKWQEENRRGQAKGYEGAFSEQAKRSRQEREGAASASEARTGGAQPKAKNAKASGAASASSSTSANTAASAAGSTSASKPIILMNVARMGDAVRDAMQHLVDRKVPIYQRDGVLVWPAEDPGRDSKGNAIKNFRVDQADEWELEADAV